MAIAPNKPLIEIHRVWDSGSGHDRTIYTKDELHRRFASLNEQLINAGLTVKIYVWPDFHDRYLITDVMGLSIPYGFDISTAQDETTTWTRLSRRDRDAIQLEFDPAKKQPLFDFEIGVT